VTVRATVLGPDSVEAPLAGTAIIALPYDRDSLRAALESAGSPRPSTAELDSLRAAFRGPFVAYSLASARIARLEDSLAASGGSGAAGTALEAALADARRRRDAARSALDTARAALAARDSALRAPIVAWQDTTFRGWDTLTAGLVERSGLDPVVDTTDATGWAELRLRADRDWWIWVESIDVYDPNARWYWNVRAQGDTVLLSSRNGRSVPRY
jgi:hypothetical protein